MPYATAADLHLPEQTLIWLTTEPDDQADAPDAAVLTAALAAAEALVHSYLRNRFAQLPLPDPAGELRDLVVAIARYRLHSPRPTLLEQQPTLRQDYEDALKALAEIRDGKRTPAGAASDPNTLPADGGRMRVVAPARTFTADIWERY